MGFRAPSQSRLRGENARRLSESQRFAPLWQAVEKGILQPAPSLLSLPKGEKIQEGSQFLCRVLRTGIFPTRSILLFRYPARRFQFQGHAFGRRLGLKHPAYLGAAGEY